MLSADGSTYAIVQFIIGLIILVGSADRFICSCIYVSERFNIPKALVGLTIVAIGTSLPELVLTIVAVSKGEADIAIGNVVGSNISNIGLVFASSMIINRKIFEPIKNLSDIYALVIITMSVGIVMYVYGTLTYIHSIILFAAAMIATYIMFAKRSQQTQLQQTDVDLEHCETTIKSGLKHTIQLLVCAMLIPISADQLLTGGIEIAKIFDINPLVIGLIFMAIGTSLPELATSISAAIRGEQGIVIGNIIGSNIFNITLVLGSASILEDINIAAPIRNFDAFLMMFLTAIFALIYVVKKPKLHFVYFSIIFAGYIYFIYHSLTLPSSLSSS